MAWRHALSGCLLIFAVAAVAEKCQTGCKSDLAPNGHAPLAKGISLLQAMSRNKSASKNVTTGADPSSTFGSSNGSVGSNVSIGNISAGLENAIAIANTVGSAAAAAAGIQDQYSSTGNETGFLVPEQNLSSVSQGVNYSVVSDEEVAPPEPLEPYAAAENSSKNSSEVVKIHPIPGASPLPEPDGSNLTSAMKDCIMADWGEWSECLTDNANGYAGPHQVRERSIVQPYLPGGELCGLTMESRTCQLISAANTLVNLGG
mmetsp:Transcript_88887/g.141537  ORF Transcript_88887/g.141537 Transcript_88887/m.141537 type:complete len:260 (-) Transcript_88887:70-849(-)